MTAGFQCINDNGIVQIDENYRNLVFIQKWVFSTAGDHTFTTGTGRVAPVPVFYSTYAGTSQANSGIYLRQSTNNGNGTWTYTVNGTGEVHLFDLPPAPAAHGSGLQVFNASGQIVFDSATKPFVVRAARNWSGPAAYWNIPTQTLSVAPESYGSSVVEDTQFGTFAAFTKTSAEKWGWVAPFRASQFVNTPAAGGPSSSPYGAGDGNYHIGMAAIHAVGDTFVVNFRDFIDTSPYVNYGVGGDWSCHIKLVDLTNL